MTFMEHSAKHPMLSHFQADLELSSKSFIALSSSTLERHKEKNAQGLFAARALDGLSRSSVENGSTVQAASGSVIPHWMSSNQVQNIPLNTTPKSGLTSNMVEILGAVSALPSPKLGLGSEGHTNCSIMLDLSDGLVNSRPLSQQQSPAQPPHTVCVAPTFSLERDGGQKEDLPILSLGLSSRQISHERAEASSWVSKFPFQIASGLGHAEHGQSTNSSGAQHLSEGEHREFASIASQFMGSNGRIDRTQIMDPKGQIDHTQVLLEQSQSLIEVVPSQKTGLANSSLHDAWPLPATISGAIAPSLKRTRNEALKQDARHPHLLPDFFAQQKVMVSTKVNRPHFAKSEGSVKIGKVAFSQKSLASRVNEDNAGLKLASLHGTVCSDKSRNPFTGHKSIEQQETKEALKSSTLPCPQSLHDTLQRPAGLVKESVRAMGSRFASTKPLEKYDKIAGFEGRVMIEAVPLSRAPAVDQAAREPLNITSETNKMVSASQPAELMLFRDGAFAELMSPSRSSGLEEGKSSAQKYSKGDQDWGEFLAAPPSFGQNAGIKGKLMLPIQQRFEQLQKFLRKCDGSHDEYCLQALCFLSKNAWHYQSAELESRAFRLSVEEGKELKRAKLLNMLEELP